MIARTVWKEKLKLSGEADGHFVDMDAKVPMGSGSGFAPKELVVLGLCGCTNMDVAAYLRKFKEPLESVEVTADVTMSERVQPTVFTNIALTFTLTGNMGRERVEEAVRLSQTKFCGVSAMLLKAVPIQYKIVLNGEPVGEGVSHFG